MIFSLNSDKPMGESTQVAINRAKKIFRKYKNFIQNTDFAFELEENMKKSIKKGIVSRLKELGIVFDETDDKAIWKALSTCYKSYGFDNDKKHWERISKNVKNWIKNGTLSTDIDNRKNMYDLCMVLDMNIEETKEFFSKSFYTLAFNYKNRTDAIYYYCINNHKSCSETQKIIEIVGELNDDTVEDKNTFEIECQILDIDNDEEFFEYVKKHCFSNGKQMRTARKTIRYLYEECEKRYRNGIDFEQMTREKVEKKMQDNNTDNEDKIYNKEKTRKISQKELINNIYGINISKKGKKAFNGKIPDSVIKSLPMEEEISKILNENEDKVSYEDLRKTIIILKFYEYYLDKVYESRDDIEKFIDDFYSEINLELTEVGYSILNVKHPFDWLILYCAYKPEPIMSLRKYFRQKYEDTREHKE